MTKLRGAVISRLVTKNYCVRNALSTFFFFLSRSSLLGHRRRRRRCHRHRRRRVRLRRDPVPRDIQGGFQVASLFAPTTLIFSNFHEKETEKE